MYIIHGNFGNHTIALMQWALEQNLSNVFIISIETGWSASSWSARVKDGETLAKAYGFKIVRLFPNADFTHLIQDRKEFPSQKFQWCSIFLKGLTLLDWLDKEDPDFAATIIYGKRRVDSRRNWQLDEFIESCVHHGDRKVWYPLYKHTHEQFIHLINQTGLDVLPHRSLECDPCIHNSPADFARMDKKSIIRLKSLENEIGKPMFVDNIEHQAAQTHNTIDAVQALEQFDMGCGSVYGCGE